MSENKKRKRALSQKAKESVEPWQTASSEGKCQLWCTVQLTKNDGTTKKYDVRSSYLETENGEKVTLKDLFYGSNVIWKARGRPYSVVVMETHRKKPEKVNAVILSESDSEELEHTKKGSIDTTITTSDDEKEMEEESIKESQEIFTQLTQVPLPQKRCFKDDDDDDENELAPKRDSQDSASLEDLPFATQITVDNRMPNPFLTPTSSKSKKAPERSSLSKENYSPFSSPFASECSPSTDLHQTLGRIEHKMDIILKYMKQSKQYTKGGPANKSSEDEKKAKFTTDKGVYLLDIMATDPGKYALQLMDSLFTVDEMATHCFEKTKLSKKESLDKEKVNLIYDCIGKKFGQETFEAKHTSIVRKCNQKCLDRHRAKFGHSS